MDSFEHAVHEAIDSKIVSGAAVIGIYRTQDGGYERYEKSFGKESIDSDAPDLTTHSLLWVFSCTKLLTAIAVMQLVERKLVSLDEPLSDLLPEYRPPIPVAGSVAPDGGPVMTSTDRPLTLRRLLSHTAGFAYEDEGDNALGAWRASLPASDPRAARNAPRPHRQDLDLQYRVPLVFEPGAPGRWNYGCGVDWAGRAVERAAAAAGEGLSLGAYMARHVWAPLGMRSTTFRPLSAAATAPPSRRSDRASGGAAGLVAGSTDVYAHVEPVDECGGIGLYSTARDFSRVLESLLRDDWRLLSSEAAAELFRPQLPDHPDIQASLAQAEDAKVMVMGTSVERPEDLRWNHSLGGLLAQDPVPGKFGAGVMAWSGLCNSFWWIDRNKGTAGFYGSQLLPVGDLPTQTLYSEFQKGISRLAS